MITQRTFIMQSKKRNLIKQVGSLAGICLIYLFAIPGAYAQEEAGELKTTGIQKIEASGTHVDYLVPASMKDQVLYLEAHGGDGGEARKLDGKDGGGAAIATGYIKIGNGANEISPGDTIRFIVGQTGHSGPRHGGGGGGTAVVFKRPGEDDWNLLMVAGGGGGSGWKYSGRSANVAEGGSNGIGGDGIKLNNAGSDGQGGSDGKVAADSYAGGGAYSDGASDNGGDAGFDEKSKLPTGGAGGESTLKHSVSGGFGFGGGGLGFTELGYLSGGGGGGYSGGGGGKKNGGGGGGGSYVDHQWLIDGLRVKNPTTGDPVDGYIKYQVLNKIPNASIRFSADNNKCMDVKNSGTWNGNDIRLWSCEGGRSQRWFFHNEFIYSGLDVDRCLDLAKNNTANGTNIRLWDCNYSDAQRWTYDGVSKQMRHWVKWNKCLDAGANNNIRIWDCEDKINQQWDIDEADWKVSGQASNAKNIYPVKGPHKCMELWAGDTDNGSDIWIRNCSGGKTQQWLFDGVNIRYRARRDKCLKLENGNTKDYTLIQIWDCDPNDKAQRWFYDGFSGTIRYWENKEKCMALSGTFVAIKDCDGNPYQQWGIKTAGTN